MECTEFSFMTGVKKKKDIENILDRSEESGLSFFFPRIVGDKDNSNTDVVDSSGSIISELSSQLCLKMAGELFFEFEKHEELFKLGKHFFNDLNEEVSRFGFCHTRGNEGAQTIIALSSFFAKEHDASSLIITNRASLKAYEDVLGELRSKAFVTKESGFEVELYFSGGFYILDIDNFTQKYSWDLQRDVLEEILGEVNLSLWNLPEIEKIKNNPEVYLLCLNFIHNVSLFVDLKNTEIRKVALAEEYFLKYSIPIKGFIVNFPMVIKSE